MKRSSFTLAILLICSYVNAQNWNQIDKSVPPPYTTNTGYAYGGAIAIDGDYAVIAATAYSDKKGVAFVVFYNGTNWVTQATLTADDGATLDIFGSSVSISGDHIVVGAKWNEGNEDKSGSAYVFTKPGAGWSDMTQTAKLTLSDGTRYDYFGVSVGISGGNIVVGAYGDDENGDNSGAAYIFSKPNNGWVDMTQTAKLTASDGVDFDLFGYSACISGDNVVVGASGDDNDKNHEVGSAYIYTKPVGGWVDTTQNAKLVASDSRSNADFGSSLSISGDYIIIGAPGDDAGGFKRSSGSAYLFEKPAEGWVNATQNGKFGGDDLDTEDNFGRSVCISDNNIVVGASGDDDVRIGAGAAYIFTKAADGWTNMTKTSKLTSADCNEEDYFGGSVSISGNKILIGASYSKSPGFISGAVYTFNEPVGGWETSSNADSKLVPKTHSGTEYDNYGFSSAIDSNYAVIGAYKSLGLNGSVHVLFYDGNNWITQAKLTVKDTLPIKYFGKSVDISGNTIVVGAGRNNDDNLGYAYVFEKPIGGWVDMTQTAKLSSNESIIGDYYGKSVSVDGDNIIVGAAAASNNGIRSGAAFIFTRPENGWLDTIPSVKLVADEGDQWDNFGSSVCISNETVVVGAEYDTPNANRCGSAYIFIQPAEGWKNMTENAKIISSDGADYDFFGKSISISHDNIVVGANGDDNVGSNSGSAYVFTKPLGGWVDTTETAKLTADNASRGAHFGNTVRISKNNIVVGAMNGVDNGLSSGSAYLFTKPDGKWIDTTQSVTLRADDAVYNFQFGRSVSIFDNHIVVGATGADGDGSSERGSAYFFKKGCKNIDLTITNSSNTLTSNQSGATYQWLDCNSNYTYILGETNQTFTTESTGSYAAKISIGSCIDTSACEQVLITDVEDRTYENQFQVVPNPNNGTFSLKTRGLTTNTKVQIVNLLGERIAEYYSTAPSTDLELNLNNGIYFILINGKAQKMVVKH